MTTITDVLRQLGRSPTVTPLSVPPYRFPLEERTTKVGLAVEDMKRDITQEGFQIFQGLEAAGYALAGYKLLTKDWSGQRWVQHHPDMTDCREIVDRLNPSTVVVQDHREWDPVIVRHRDRRYAFQNTGILRERDDIFKVTILKDAHQRPHYHRQCAEQIACHGWIVYYHPQIVSHLAPYVRPEHLIRTYHTLDPLEVPPYNHHERLGCVVSGAIGAAYPLRTRLVRELFKLPFTKHLRHPGYGNRGCYTPQYLKELSRFKVSICTSSIYGYALRKIIESTAVGCIVITDLPVEDELPWLDGNLVRVDSSITTDQLAVIVRREIQNYNPERQEHFAQIATQRYDYKVVCQKLAHDIEQLRVSYNKPR